MLFMNIVDDTVRYSMASPFDRHVRPKSVQLPLQEIKTQTFSCYITRTTINFMASSIHKTIPIDRQEILKIVSHKMIRKRISLEKNSLCCCTY